MENRLDSALIALRQIFRATETNSRALAKMSGLSTSQYIVLQILSDQRGLTHAALASEISLSQATVTALIDKLESRGLVLRIRDAQDKRRILLEITDQGRQILNAAPSLLQTRFDERFALLEDWEQAFLVAALERTAKLLDAQNIDAAPVLDVGDLIPTSR